MYPNFICIGAQRSGTTWLYRNLATHPSLWLPPVKELHFFGSVYRRPLALAALLRGPEGRRSRRVLGELAREVAGAGYSSRVAWFLRYALLPRGPGWYGSLFDGEPGQFAGEISPEYAPLDAGRVRRLRAVAPELRVIYLLRDPIDRAWSQAAKYFAARVAGGIDAAPRARAAAFLARHRTLRHSSYATNLAIWETHFPRAQIFVAFYEQLEEDPGGLLAAICRFLGVDDGHVADAVDVRRNARSYRPISRELAAPLALALRDEIERTHERFDNRYTHAWLTHALELDPGRGRPARAKMDL